MMRATAFLAAMIAASSFAHADDMTDRYGDIFSPAENIDWSGPYAGAVTGHVWSAVDMTGIGAGDDFVDLGPNPYEFDMSGWSLGGTLGYNAVIDNYLIGIEADTAFADIDSSLARAYSVDYMSDGQRVSGQEYGKVAADLRWLSTIRARAGFMAERFLPYLTGGIAFGQGQVTVDGGFNADALSEVASVGFTTSDKQTHVGYVVGGGVEALLIENLSAKIEYLYYDLGEEKYKGSFGGVPVSVSGELDGHIVRAGLNYGF